LAAPTLRRLVGADVAQLLDSVTSAVPGLALAIVGNDGEVAHASGPWPNGALENGLGNGAPSFDLVPRTELMGRLVARGDVPSSLLAGMGQSVALLLREALEKHELVRETLDRYREINLLYRASETIGASINPAEVPRLLLHEAERVIASDEAEFLIGDEAPSAKWSVAADLIDEVRVTGRPDIAFFVSGEGAAGAPTLQSALCVPVRAGERVLGVVVLGRNLGRPPFTASDEKLLLGLASQAGVALERAWLHEQETRRLQLEEELAVARRIQLTLLPSAPPSVPGWGFAATYRAARQVGGDFYDFLDQGLPGRRLGIVIADVTGKGIPAALVMAYSRAVVRAESLAGSSPVEVLTNANRLLMQEHKSRLFVSAFYAEIELDTGLLTYASAGHDAPLLLSAHGTTSELAAPGVILGAFHDIGLESRSVMLGPGDTVIMFTDGVTEARDPERRLFGDERLEQAVATAVAEGGNAEAVLESVIVAVARFTAGAEQFDDLTMVVVQREEA
jgi:serine phosphatase RsbU (regulator of sigma subunit)